MMVASWRLVISVLIPKVITLDFTLNLRYFYTDSFGRDLGTGNHWQQCGIVIDLGKKYVNGNFIGDVGKFNLWNISIIWMIYQGIVDYHPLIWHNLISNIDMELRYGDFFCFKFLLRQI